MKLYGLYVDTFGGFYESTDLHSVYTSMENAKEGALKWVCETIERHDELEAFTDEKGVYHKPSWYDWTVLSREWKDETLYLEVQSSDSEFEPDGKNWGVKPYAYIEELPEPDVFLNEEYNEN